MIAVRIPRYAQHVQPSTLVSRLSDFLSTIDYGVRFLSRTRPIPLAAKHVELQHAIQTADAWKLPYLRDQQRMLRTLTDRGARTVDHFLLAWPPSARIPQIKIRLPAVLHTTPDQVVEDMPALVPPGYTPKPLYLEPPRRGMPLLAVLSAWDALGTWDTTSWDDLFSLPLDLALAIDLVPVPAREVSQAITASMRTPVAPWDTRGLQRREDVQTRVQPALRSQSVLHAHYAVLISGVGEAQLEANARLVQETMQHHLKLQRLPHAQHEYIKLFMAQPFAAVHVPTVTRPILSQGAAITFPAFVQKRDSTDGILFGEHTKDGTPIFHELFDASGRRNASSVILGLPDRGKSVLFMTLALRHTLYSKRKYKVVYCEPTGKNSQRLATAIGDRQAVDYVDLADTPSINVLDPLSADPDKQYLAVLSSLQAALGELVEDGLRWHIQPRRFSAKERRLLDKALQHDLIYGPDCLKLHCITPETAPLLETLALVLEELGCGDLADDIADKLLGTSKRIYNTPTSLRFTTDADVLIYSIAGANKHLLTLCYARIFEWTNQYLRSPQRDPAERLLFLADEWWVASQLDIMDAKGLEMAKTARNVGGAFIAGDQQGTALIKRGQPSLLGTVDHLFLFALSGEEQQAVLDLYGNVIPKVYHSQLLHLEPGHCIAKLRDQVVPLRIQLGEYEYAQLAA